MKPLYLFLGVIISISITNFIIIFADPENKIIYSSWILIINSLIAAALSVMVLLKDKDSSSSSKKDKTKIHLTLGLVFWFIANIIWGYYEIVLDIVSPVPSLADVFLLSAYGFLIYRMIITYKEIGHTINNKILFLIIAVTGLFLIYILNLTLNLTETSSFRGLMLFAVTIAYPTFNSILTVLALMILIGIKDEKHHFIPWVSELVGLLAIVVGDSWFAIIVLTSFVEQLWISALLLSAHYLLIAGGLVWYLRYSVKWHQPNGLIFRAFARISKVFSKKVLIGSLLPSITLIIIFGLYTATNVFSNNESNYFINKRTFNFQSPHLNQENGKEGICDWCHFTIYRLPILHG